MTALAALETVLLIVAIIVATRGVEPAAPPHGRRFVWIAVLLALQAALFYGFVAVLRRTHWGIESGSMPGVAVVFQGLRALLLLAAVRSWLRIVGGELNRVPKRVIVAVAVFTFGWGSGGLPVIAAIALMFVLDRMKWIEAITGWRRGAGLAGCLVLLALLSILPFASVQHGAIHARLALNAPHWPPPLLFGATDPRAAAELAILRPLDRFVQALVDLFRAQLVIASAKLLFLPVRLSGMSLKRRFTINYLLVRSIPAFLSGLILVVFGYLVFGQAKLARVRGGLERTLARAGTVAAVLADDPAVRDRRPFDRARIERAARWMDADSTHVSIVVRDPRVRVPASEDTLTPGTARDDSVWAAATNPGVPGPLLVRSFAGADSGEASGLVVAGDRFYLGVRRVLAEGRAIEVFTPVDSAYLARIMEPIGGDLRITAHPDQRLGGGRMELLTPHWIPQVVTVSAREPDPGGRPQRRWYLARSYVPEGDWSGEPLTSDRGAVEVKLETLPQSLLRGATRSFASVYANLMTLLIVIAIVMVFSMIERFAVRSGRSIIDAVLDEMTTLRDATERFGAGDLSYRLPVRGRDEFSVVATSFNRMAENLESQRSELVTKQRLDQDLEVARVIQQRFLPRTAPTVAGLDAAGISVPSREVGGDLFQWFAHADGPLGLALGDVSGKSMSAALLMSNVLAALRTQAFDRVDLADTLGRTNRLLLDMTDPGTFVTLFYGEADCAAGTLRYASAGHNPPLLLRAGGGADWLREGGVPLGILPEASYAVASTRFEPGDMLIVYSDGVTEARRPDDQMYGEDRLAALAATLHGRPAQSVLDGVLASVNAFAAGAAQADDLTIVVVRRV